MRRLFPPFFGQKKKKREKEEKSAGQGKQNCFSIAQGLDSPLASYERGQS